jgi:hypothetical protein
MKQIFVLGEWMEITDEAYQPSNMPGRGASKPCWTNRSGTELPAACSGRLLLARRCAARIAALHIPKDLEGQIWVGVEHASVFKRWSRANPRNRQSIDIASSRGARPRAH